MTFQSNPPKAEASNRLPNTERPPHLTAELMEAMLRPSPFRKQAAKHLESCASCREEVEDLSELLSQFRGTSVLYAAKAQNGWESNEGQSTHHRSAAHLWRWSIAAGALACAVVTLPLLHGVKPTKSNSPFGVQSPAAGQPFETSDDALLEDVQNDLASSVPRPLEVLAGTSSNAPAATSSMAGVVGPTSRLNARAFTH